MNELNRKIEAAKKAHQAALKALRAIDTYHDDRTVIVQAKGKEGYYAARKAKEAQLAREVQARNLAEIYS